MVHIPFYTYFSEAYAQNNPQVIDACRQNRSAYFTNDLIFDTMTDIMQIHLPALKTENSLANKNYQHTHADLKTLYGKKALVKIANNFLSSILLTSTKNAHKSIVSVFYLVYEPTYSFFA